MAPRKSRKRKIHPSHSSQPSQSSQPSECSQTSKKITRTKGASLLKKFTKNIGEGKRLDVAFNRKGQPIGDNKDKFVTFIGSTAKEIVPITINDWRFVEEDLNQIWHKVTEVFVLSDDKEDWVLDKARQLWSNFKKMLRSKWLIDEKTGDIQISHPSIYDSFIKKEHWTEFLKITESEEFKKKREKMKQLSLLNDNTYRGSKNGYAGVEEKYKKEHNMDPSAIVPRAILYKEARKDKDGQISDKAREVVEKIDLYLEKESNGEFVANGRNDVLAMALGKQEHPGRVRGVGQDVNVSGYFGHASRRGQSRVDVEEAAINEATKRLQANMKAEIESMFDEERQTTRQFIQALLKEREQYIPGKPLPEMPSFSKCMPEVHPPTSNAPDSITKGAWSTSKKDGTSECRLFWPNLKKEVAKGIVYHSSPGATVMLHTGPLKNGQVRVTVVAPLEAAKGVEVPFPSDEVLTIVDSIGYFIAWPDHLVLPIQASTGSCDLKKMEKDRPSSKVSSPMDKDLVPSIIDDFRWMLDEFEDGVLRYVKIPKQLFNHNHLDISIGKEKIQMWLDKKAMDMCHVSIYMRYLLETHCQDDMFRFLSPSLVSPNGDGGSIQNRASYIANAMKGNVENRLFFAPYKIGQRWVLLALHPHYGYAYWIDPLHKGQELDADQLIELSYTLKFTDLQRNKPRKQILWHVIKCPHQTSFIESGYYVLKFMREIMRRKSVSIPKIWYGNKDTFSEDEIDEIRKEWMEYLLRLIF